VRKLLIATLPCLTLGLAAPAFAATSATHDRGTAQHDGASTGTASFTRNHDTGPGEPDRSGDTAAPGEVCPLAYDLTSNCLRNAAADQP
jgi:hypothetical protein